MRFLRPATWPWGSIAVAAALIGAPAEATQTGASEACSMHIYPADGVHSVGEDFDAVHQVDQDLRHYYETAGKPLDWLTPVRQLALLGSLPLGELASATSISVVMHPEPLSRHQALQPGQRETAQGCIIEVMIPQIMLERGGLATRSMRLFGIVRRYENKSLVQSYSGFSAAPMSGFQLKTAADAPAATAVVEQAYRAAVETLLRNSNKQSSK